MRYASSGQLERCNRWHLSIVWNCLAGCQVNKQFREEQGGFSRDGALFSEPKVLLTANLGPRVTGGRKSCCRMWTDGQRSAIKVQEQRYEKPCTESLAYRGGSDSCGGLRPAQAGKPDHRYRHHQG